MVDTNRKTKHQAKNILIRRVDNIGDIILLLPALKLLRAHFQNDRLTLMVKPEHRVLVNHYADDFLSPVPVDDFKALSSFYDHCINIEYSLPPGVKPAKKLLPVTHMGGLNILKPYHISKRVTLAIKSFGLQGRHYKPKLPLQTTAKVAAALWLKQNNINTKGSLIISLDPNSGMEKKSWLLSGFLQVCRYLIKELNATIIIPAPAAGNARVMHLQNNLPAGKCHVLSGFPLDVVAAVLKKCDLHVGNDSGIGHLAASVNTPTVTIFGPTDPFLWKPYGKKSIVVSKPETQCPGGYEHAMQCKLQKCLLAIKPHDVIDGVLFSLTNYANPEKFFGTVAFKPSKNLKAQKTIKGHVLKNTKTGHACFIKNGWPGIKAVLKQIERKGSAIHVLQEQPHHLPLINMLIMHRLLEPGNIAKRK